MVQIIREGELYGFMAPPLWCPAKLRATGGPSAGAFDIWAVEALPIRYRHCDGRIGCLSAGDSGVWAVEAVPK